MWFTETDPLADWLEDPYDTEAAVEVAKTYDPEELEGVHRTLQLLGEAYDEWSGMELSRLQDEQAINAQRRENRSDAMDAILYGGANRLRDLAVGTVDAGADVVETGVDRGADIVETGVERTGDILDETGDAGESLVYAVQNPTQNAVRAGGELAGEGVSAVSQPVVKGIEGYQDVRQTASGGQSGFESQRQPEQPGAV